MKLPPPTPRAPELGPHTVDVGPGRPRRHRHGRVVSSLFIDSAARNGWPAAGRGPDSPPGQGAGRGSIYRPTARAVPWRPRPLARDSEISYSGPGGGGGGPAGAVHVRGGGTAILARAGAVNMAGGPCPPLVVSTDWTQSSRGRAGLRRLTGSSGSGPPTAGLRARPGHRSCKRDASSSRQRRPSRPRSWGHPWWGCRGPRPPLPPGR